MDDSRCLRFFLEPTDTLHRRYEALRAYFVERRPLKPIAQEFGYTYNTPRGVIADFRARCRQDQIPPFSWHLNRGDRTGNRRIRRSSRKSRPWPTVADWTSPQHAA